MSSPGDRGDLDAALRQLAAGRLPAEEARAVRARLADDPDLLARFGRLSAETRTTPSSASPPPRRYLGALSLRSAVLALAGLVLVVAALVTVAVMTRPTEPVARPQPGVAVEVRSADLSRLWPSVAGRYDFAVLGSADKAQTCLGLGFESSTILGAMPVVVDGRYGVLIAHSGSLDEPSTIGLDVLSRDCASGLGQPPLASATVRR